MVAAVTHEGGYTPTGPETPLAAAMVEAQIPDASSRWVPPSALRRWEKNPRKNDPAVPRVRASLQRFGFVAPIVVWLSANRMVAGDTRLKAARALFADEPETVLKGAPGPGLVRVVFHDFASEAEADAYALADNKLGELAEWDETLLHEALAKLDAEDRVVAGFDEELRTLPDGDGESGGSSGSTAGDAAKAKSVGALRERFLVPPFSVLDARQGYWQDRKRAWIDLGLRSEEGRGENLIGRSVYEIAAFVMGGQYDDARKHVDARRAAGLSDLAITQELGAAPANPSIGAVPANVEQKIPGFYDKLKAGQTKEEIVAEWLAGGGATGGTSIFDPMLCELAYRWFCPPSGRVLDPFAGGSVRGIVAAVLGRSYTGVDLRAEQTEANREQWLALAETYPDVPSPTWLDGDSREVLGDKVETDVDFVFSCPPYADLEVYSDDPRDLSTMAYKDFVKAYEQIIRLAVGRLKQDRFACFVVGEVREKGKADVDDVGAYLGFVPATIKAFEKAGARFYNEAILVSALGTTPLRAGRMFGSTRKLGKAHQNVLVFCKGDPRKAVEAIGEIEFGEPGEVEDRVVGGVEEMTLGGEA